MRNVESHTVNMRNYASTKDLRKWLKRAGIFRRKTKTNGATGYVNKPRYVKQQRYQMTGSNSSMFFLSFVVLCNGRDGRQAMPRAKLAHGMVNYVLL